MRGSKAVNRQRIGWMRSTGRFTPPPPDTLTSRGSEPGRAGSGWRPICGPRSGCSVIDDYRADGESGDLNRYTVLRRTLTSPSLLAERGQGW